MREISYVLYASALSFARANDAKIVRSRDAQCKTREPRGRHNLDQMVSRVCTLYLELCWTNFKNHYFDMLDEWNCSSAVMDNFLEM